MTKHLTWKLLNRGTMARTHPITFVQLMFDSERALWKTDTHPEYYRGPLANLLDDGAQYGKWEAYHARHMREVADCARQSQQAVALRKIAIQCVHRRGLIDHLRVSQIVGDERKRLFEVFYGPTDHHKAVITEHRQYILAASTGYCAEVLVNSISDFNGARLLDRYQRLYAQYFQIFAQYMQADYRGDEELAGALRPTMLEYRAFANRSRRQILVQPSARPPVRVSPSQRSVQIKSSAILRSPPAAR
jgi:hypothetical protein